MQHIHDTGFIETIPTRQALAGAIVEAHGLDALCQILANQRTLALAICGVDGENAGTLVIARHPIEDAKDAMDAQLDLIQSRMEARADA